jgi:hypothetical protein
VAMVGCFRARVVQRYRKVVRRAAIGSPSRYLRRSSASARAES